MTEPTKKKILVVEDNMALASVVRYNLLRAGYEAQVATNGCDGLKLATTESFDLIITDQQMPLMSGCEMCEKLRQSDEYSSIPIIMLTAKGLELDLGRLAKEYGVTATFAKPFSPKEVIAAVNEYLTLSPAPSSQRD